MNGRQPQQQIFATSTNKDNAGVGASAPTPRPGIKMHSQDQPASVQAQAQAQAASTPSMTGAVGTGPANGGSTTSTASPTTTTSAAATAAINKKRKKEGLKPIITTEYVLFDSIMSPTCATFVLSFRVVLSYFGHFFPSRRIASHRTH